MAPALQRLLPMRPVYVVEHDAEMDEPADQDLDATSTTR